MPVDDDWLNKLGLLLGGGLFGAMLLESHYDDKRKSRAEKTPRAARSCAIQ
jgi:hypothetical protein